MAGVQECVAYFKNNNGFVRLMNGINDLYIRYGRCFGAARLIGPTTEEEKAVSEFFKRDYYNQKLIRIGLADFERQLQRLFGEDMQLGQLLAAYYNKPIANREVSKTNSRLMQFIEETMLPKYNDTVAERWLIEVSTHLRRVYRMLSSLYTVDEDAAEKMLTTVTEAYVHLPCDQGDQSDQGDINDANTTESQGQPVKLVPLTTFATTYAGGPYALDMNSTYGILFLRALAYRFAVGLPNTPEECVELYYKAGLLSDGVLIRTAVRGLRAWRGDAEDAPCMAYDLCNEPHMLTLENISCFTQAKAHDDRVFVVEHLHIFTALNERLRDRRFTMLCVGDHLNPAAMALLDLLCAEGAKLYYSGDMNFPGLYLADKVYLRYPDRFVPWRYDKDDYERVIPESTMYPLDSKRDTGLHNETLAALLSLIRKKGKVASQRVLLAQLVSDLRDETL